MTLLNIMIFTIQLAPSIAESSAAVPASVSRAGRSPVSRHAAETIELLRSALEKCHVDLETDEELFAEKVEELNDLQSSYSLLLSEKEKIEEIWRSARETEGQLTSELGELLERIAKLEEELMARDGIIGQLRESLRQRAKGDTLVERRRGENGGSVEDSGRGLLGETSREEVPEDGGMDVEAGDESIQSHSEQGALFHDFMANRSLIKGRVKADGVEVSL